MRFAASAVLLAFALGCGSTPDKDKPADPKKPGDPVKPDTPAPAPTPPAEDPKASAQKFVADFWAALQAKKATADQLTADFKKIVAPPRTSDDEAKGYSDLGAKDYLDKWLATADAPKAEVIGDVAFAAGKPGAGGRALIRLAKDGGAWKVDWLSNGPATATDAPLTGGEDTAGVQFAVAAFTDAVFKKDFALVAGLFAPAARARIAPPFTADEAIGFSRKLLRQKVEDEFGKAERGYIVGTTRDGGKADVKVELSAGAEKKVLEVKLVKGTPAKPGVWLVNDFDVK